LELEQRLWSHALRHISPLPGFLAGAALGNWGARWLSKWRVPRALVLGLLMELVLLALARLLIHLLPCARVWCAALLATSMGLQNAALRRVAKHDVRTTFITGMLIAFVDESIEYFSKERSSARPGLHAGLWCGFFSGAFGGAWATARFGMSALFMAMAFVLCAIPLALGSEAPPGDAAPNQA
ncbi:MAG TPA: YoaK family protein, partial [Polyangiaceae bacterium]|nr:YoaK family protein [Polyangiaceae bacterium]